jgi:pimeloyl-ACP methyl ester carboxylesterase
MLFMPSSDLALYTKIELGAVYKERSHRVTVFLLRQGYRVYAVDLLGFGGSDKPREVEVFCLELWRDLLLDFMKEVGHVVMMIKMITIIIKSPPLIIIIILLLNLIIILPLQVESRERGGWVVMGNSIGGLLSLLVARAKAEAVRGVVLFNCAGGMVR